MQVRDPRDAFLGTDIHVCLRMRIYSRARMFAPLLGSNAHPSFLSSQRLTSLIACMKSLIVTTTGTFALPIHLSERELNIPRIRQKDQIDPSETI